MLFFIRLNCSVICHMYQIHIELFSIVFLGVLRTPLKWTDCGFYY